MSLFPCRDCGKEVSLSAEKCPNCGAPHPWVSARILRNDAKSRAIDEKWRPLVVAYWVIGILVVGVGFGVIGNALRQSCFVFVIAVALLAAFFAGYEYILSFAEEEKRKVFLEPDDTKTPNAS
jgi:hypothetical protein